MDKIGEPYTEMIRVYRFDEYGAYSLIYEGAASIQPKNSTLSFGNNAITSYYVAYLPNDRVVAKPLDRIDWSGFNKDFSSRKSDWNTVMKPSFNFEGEGTTIYFNEIGI